MVECIGFHCLFDVYAPGFSSHYVHFQPLPLLTVHAERGERIEDHPNAHRAYACEISLPVHMHLTLDDVDRVVAAVRRGHDAILNDGPAS